MDLAERLRNERVRLGLTQAQLAALVGIQPNEQCLYENGSSLPRADYLMCVAGVEMDVQYILLGMRNPPARSPLSHTEGLLIQSLRGLHAEDVHAVVQISETLEKATRIGKKVDPMLELRLAALASDKCQRQCVVDHMPRTGF